MYFLKIVSRDGEFASDLESFSHYSANRDFMKLEGNPVVGFSNSVKIYLFKYNCIGEKELLYVWEIDDIDLYNSIGKYTYFGESAYDSDTKCKMETPEDLLVPLSCGVSYRKGKYILEDLEIQIPLNRSF